MRSRSIFLILPVFMALFPVSYATAARDEWLRVRSRNFVLIGNASERDVRKVAMRLEEFREAFKQVFNRAELSSPLTTTVVVFKSDDAYRPFKPRRADGSIDESITGYFMPGDDGNYITLATRGDEIDYGTIFHEYVHFIVSANYGRTGVPPWFNEGLAEYYETFSIDNDQTVKLGLLQERHLQYLKGRSLIPLSKLFNITNYGLDQESDQTRKVFYAESWVLVHYLVQAGKIEGFNRFLTAILRSVPPQQAFQQAFQMSYVEMETAIKAYVSQRSYNYHVIKFPTKLSYDATTQATALSDAEANASLGDLLYHLHRSNDAVPYLEAALRQDPELPLANAAMGMVRIQQRRADEAKKYLEKALAGDQKTFLALYRYALILSREDRDEFGLVVSFPAEKVGRMRDMLKRAIAANPTHAESYDLLAFISLANNDELAETAAILQDGLKRSHDAQPRLLLRLAEIYNRQERVEEGIAAANEASAMSDDPQIKSWADEVLAKIKGRQQAKKSIESERKRPVAGGAKGPTDFRKIELDKAPTEVEVAKLQDEAFMRALNLAVTPAGAGEVRLLGTIDHVDCSHGTISYAVRSGDDRFMLTSRDFLGLKLRSYVGNGVNRRLDCGVSLSDAPALITYKPAATARQGLRGDLRVIEFVPANFRVVDTSGAAPPTVIYPDKGPVQPRDTTSDVIQLDSEWLRRSTMLANIRSSLRQPVFGQSREIGRIQEVECAKIGVVYTIKTATRTLRLTVTSPESLAVRGYTPDIDGLQITCGVSLSDLVTVFIYKDVPDVKNGTAGELVSLEFVPKAFSL